MMDFLQRFNKQISTRPSMSSNYSQRIYLIDLMLYSEAQTLKDVDFSSFTLDELKNAMDDILDYHPDETLDSYYDKEDRNMDNPIYEINALQGMIRDISKLKPLRRKNRRFF
ncbi:hypothetical protein ACWE42_11305 [Sutcliffiella cohnii]